ncbi:hypothetical protein AAES_108188 [Amazona aestiva]|uniref:Neuregulin 2 N-terminal domain-containing protein n=1 Tax=Amazona aestiva TaxID=12930 RepID=A0A0Q3M968_AMAAE|nr:hypothetical protein AAES_108188 [Amazona aestiva]
MRRDPAPGFSMLLFGVSLACYSPSLKSVQDQAYTAAVVLEGKVLDLWHLNSGGLQREQLISVGSKAPCFKVKRNHRYIFFLEPTEEPLVFRTAFAPLDTSGKNLKRDVARILCADCDVYKRQESGILGFCDIQGISPGNPGPPLNDSTMYFLIRLRCSGRRGQLLEDTSHMEAFWTTTAHLTTLIPDSAGFKIGNSLMCESRGGGTGSPAMVSLSPPATQPGQPLHPSNASAAPAALLALEQLHTTISFPLGAGVSFRS